MVTHHIFQLLIISKAYVVSVLFLFFFFLYFYLLPLSPLSWPLSNIPFSLLKRVFPKICKIKKQLIGHDLQTNGSCKNSRVPKKNSNEWKKIINSQYINGKKNVTASVHDWLIAKIDRKNNKVKKKSVSWSVRRRVKQKNEKSANSMSWCSWPHEGTWNFPRCARARNMLDLVHWCVAHSPSLLPVVPPSLFYARVCKVLHCRRWP